MRKERSCSGGMFDFPPSSPNTSRRNKDKPHGASSTTRLRYVHSTVAQLVDLTIFHIPGLDVKVTIHGCVLAAGCSDNAFGSLAASIGCSSG